MTLPRIYLARHGETEWAVSGQHTGRTDVPLTERGERNARSLGQRLAGLMFARVLTSPLQRARRTAELAGFGAVAKVDAELTEWNYGRFEGLRTADIRKDWPTWFLFRDGCPDGESVADVSARADRVIACLRQFSGDTLIFAHGHFLRVLTARWLGLSARAASHFLCGTAALGLLGFEHNNPEEPVVCLWNDTSHVVP